MTWLRSRDVGADRRAEIIDSYSYETDVRGKLSRFAILLGLSSAIAAAGTPWQLGGGHHRRDDRGPTDGPDHRDRDRDRHRVVGARLALARDRGRRDRDDRPDRRRPRRPGSAARPSPRTARSSVGPRRPSSTWSSRWPPVPPARTPSRTARSSDSLPGVAIAISLVPPLATVGILLAYGDTAAAAGAGLLFLTNLVSIVIAASVVFVLTGVAPLVDIETPGRADAGLVRRVRRHRAGPDDPAGRSAPSRPSRPTRTSAQRRRRSKPGSNRPRRLRSSTVRRRWRSSVEVEIRGPGEPPAPAALQAGLDDRPRPAGVPPAARHPRR